MDIGSLNTIVNIAKNVSFDFELPAFKVLEKKQDVELRSYESNKYASIKFRTFDESWTNKTDIINIKTLVMNDAWRLMKYTQGENATRTQFNFLLPVFVLVERLEGVPFTPLANNKGVPLEVKTYISLPKEYQGSNEPPSPLDADIEIEVIPAFKVYARSFRGFATDGDIKKETCKLHDFLEASNLKGQKHLHITATYDHPYYNQKNVKNEVMVYAN